MPSTYSDNFPLHLIQECERLNPIVCLTVLLFALSLLVSVMVGLYLIYVTLAILEISIVALSVVALNLSVQMEMLIDWAFLYIPTGAPVLGVSVPRTPSQAAHNPVLPMELQDTIIHICDKSTLSSCSLVCSTWLPLCRRRMTFAVQSRHHTAELGRLLRNSRETISPYLRHLIISSEREAGNTSGLLQHKRLLRLLWLKHAPLQSVILLNTLPAVIALSQYFPNITSLSYRLSRPPEFWGGILDFHNLLTVVPAFHQLILLSFDDQWILPSLRPGEDKQISGGPLPITNVEIRTSFPAIFPVLRQLEKRCKNLVSFYCDIPLISYGSDMSEEVATINNILKCNRQTLLHLTLPVHSGRCMSF